MSHLVPVCELLKGDTMTEVGGILSKRAVLISSLIAPALLLYSLSAHVQSRQNAESDRCQQPQRIVLPLF